VSGPPPERRRHHHVSAQFVRFAIVGVACFAVTLATFALVNHVGGHYLTAGVAGYSAGIVLGFLLNRHWTFEAGGKPVRGQAARFLVTSAVGITVNAVLLRLFVGELEIAKLASEVGAVSLTAPVTFTINRLWSFA
jgi:putative flippase GtrA